MKSMKFFVAVGVLVLAISADAGPSMHNPFYCYMTDPIRAMSIRHSHISSYEAIRRINLSSPPNPYISTCTPSRFWYLGRTGTRLPQSAELEALIDFMNSSVQADIVRNYEAGRTSLCRADFEMIRDFTNEWNIDDAAQTTASGLIAMENIAIRYQQIFPNLLTDTYSPDHFRFRHGASSGSERAFARGLFGEDGLEDVTFEHESENDWFLQPFYICPDFNDLTETYEEQDAFREGPEIEEMVEQVNRKLGFHSSNRLSFDQVVDMWNFCRYEKSETFELSDSPTGPNSTWCAAFSPAHHIVLEYYYELWLYYFCGYGFRNQRLLENLNCGLVQDLLSVIQSTDNNDRPVRIYISYAQSLGAMMVLLGTFRDTWPLHQHNFAQQVERNYLSSILMGFAANLAVVRYDCEDGDHDLVFLFNESPILVPGCDQQTGVCKVSVIVDRFQRFINADCETHFCSSN